MSGKVNKLKVNLKLSVHRIKMATAKQESLQQHSRKEIAELLAKGKVESARIKVEHIIRQDYNKEAMEVIELFCELLIARMSLLMEGGKQCDSSLQEAVHTIIYAASRAEIKELMESRDLLIKRFGRDFGEAALANRFGIVNPRVLQRLHITIPDPAIVTAYLVEIAAKYNVPFTPDAPIENPILTPAAHQLSAQARGVDTPVVSASSGGVVPLPVVFTHAPADMPKSGSTLSIPQLPGGGESSDESSEHGDVVDPSAVDLPDAPQTLPPDDMPDEPNFDDLARRFELLKKKK
eukprot:Partr_v1_DN24546_c0_g1_i2_m19896 putative DUF292 domain containing protein